MAVPDNNTNPPASTSPPSEPAGESVNVWRECLRTLKPRTKDVYIERFGKTFTVRELSDYELEHSRAIGKLREAAGVNAEKQYGTWASYLVGLSMIDPKTGENLFKRAEIVKEMTGVPYSVVEQLTSAVLDLNGMSKKAQEDIEKNSESIPENDSGSTSASLSGAEA